MRTTHNEAYSISFGTTGPRREEEGKKLESVEIITAVRELSRCCPQKSSLPSLDEVNTDASVALSFFRFCTRLNTLEGTCRHRQVIRTTQQDHV